MTADPTHGRTPAGPYGAVPSQAAQPDGSVPSLKILRESHPTTPGVVGAVRRSAVGFAADAGMQGERLDAVSLAVSEAVTNVVVHAYPGGTGEVHLIVSSNSRELCVRILDDGIGLNAASQRPGLGLGLGLIADACDGFTLAERRPLGTMATIRFTLND